MTGGVYRPDEIVVGGSATHLAIDVVRGRDAGDQRLEGAVGLAAINVIAGYGDARLEGGRVPLQQNAVGLLGGRYPEEHYADDSQNKDRQDRNRQAQCSSQVG